MEGFLNIHQLSTQFNVSSRAIRGRLNKLVTSGKLVEGRDYRRAKYLDANHFEWQVNPMAFLQASGLTLSPVKPRPLPHAPVDGVNAGEPSGAPSVNQGSTNVHDTVNAAAATVRQGEPTSPKTAHPPVNQGEPASASPAVEREFINFLKDQISVKDGLIKDLTLRNDGLSELNKNLIGKTIQQAERIEELLTLPARSETRDAKTIKVDEPRETVVNEEQPPRSTNGSPDAATTVHEVHPPLTHSQDAVHAVNQTVNGEGDRLAA